MKVKFEKQTSPGGVDIYHHIENGNKRLQLMEDFRLGKITADQMRKQAKKIKYLFYFKDLPENYEIV